MILSILEQSLVFFPFALGMLISYGILKRADLTVDGSFVLGAGIFSKLLLLGCPLPLAMAAAVAAGVVAGVGTGILQYRERISSLISGILMLFILQSVNLIAMGRPNLNITGKPTLLNSLNASIGETFGQFTVLMLLSLAMLTLLLALMRSRVGLLLRAFGCNAQLLSLLGKNAELYRFLGLALSNGLVAYSGALTAQFNGYADIGMGTGLVLIGIGTVMIGQQMEAAIGGRIPGLFLQILCCIFGVMIYFTVVNGLASLGLNPLYLKMLIGCSLAVVLLLRVPESRTRVAA